MKFPKSMHAEGWHTHIEPTALGHVPKGLKNNTTAPKAPRADTRTRLDSPLGGTSIAAEIRTPEPARRGKVSPWLIGAGAGVALIGLAVSMSHNLSSVEPTAPPPTVAAKTPQPAPTPSPEDTQLANAPTAAGPQATTPAAEPQPQPEPAKVAALPAEPKAQAPQPVAKTLTPKAEAPVAQVAPPPRSEPATKPTVTPATTPEAATPPVAQQQPQLPPQADPEDAGITVKVRAALAADAVLSAVPIAVSTDHGVVKLEGQAPDAQAREHATVVVSSTAGVKGVDNRLTLPPVAQLQLEPRTAPTQQGS
jgi:hypothetical protein